jgi:hypothetical protein
MTVSAGWCVCHTDKTCELAALLMMDEKEATKLVASEHIGEKIQ